MTNQTNWTKFDGSDEQIAACDNVKAGFIVRYQDGSESPILHNCFPAFDFEITHYWIIPDDPLREMKVRQAHTGQPVWVSHYDDDNEEYITYSTTNPDWNIPNAEYSFTEFKD